MNNRGDAVFTMQSETPASGKAGPGSSTPGAPDLDTGQTSLGKALSRYSAYGWRGRIGLISPSTNTTIEPEFARMTPDGVSVHTSRVFQAGGQEPSSYRRMADDIETASGLLATAEIDVVTFGCTSCTYFVPPEEIIATMSEMTGKPAVLTADAVVSALNAVGARRVALVGPRTPFVMQREVDFLISSGFDVPQMRCLGLGVNEEERRAIGRVPPEVLHRLAMDVDAENADALFISCTQMPTLAMIDYLEQLTGKPVVTSNQAVFWRCLRLIGVKDRISGYGNLLSQH